METKVLVAVSKPLMYVGAPLRITLSNIGLAGVMMFLFDLTVIGIALAGVIQMVMAWRAYQNPHFDKIWAAYLGRTRTKTLLPVKGSRYVGR